MIQLPAIFTEKTRQLMGEERFERYLQSFEEDAPVSIRLNPRKSGEWKVESGERIDWCRNGYYLKQRPNFTFDPLFHAGCYYVQEAASMFLDEVLRQKLSIVNCQLSIDFCAAPGGKSTLLRSALPDDCVLYSNEPIRQRASILLENVTKWDYPNHIVTNAYPRDYRKAKMKFDLILCDVPCSGEGMFRKDPATIGEWSPQNVEKCWQLQRDIVSDAWTCLNDGGLLIYSTCTFNTKENEENIRWILSEFDDAEVLPFETEPEWNITGSLLEGFTEPVYRFIPGISRGEGLFLCVIRKVNHGDCPRCEKRSGLQGDCPRDLHPLKAETIGGNLPQVELSYPEAMKFLRGEALVLPADTPRGIVEVCFMGHALGCVKNIGSRANNLYPKPWRIKTTHIPTDYEAILRHT
jgi:16S rRNA C967 or C1407 C5-methylase (RsmB/RsmF family)